MRFHTNIYFCVQGIQKVLEGGYAYLIESSSAEFAKTQHCDLVTVGGNINLRNYALALPQVNTLF